MGTENGRGPQLGLLLGLDPLESRVIRDLGVEFAQAKVDLAFARARMEAVREVLHAARAQQEAALSSPALEGFEIPPGFTIMPGDLLLTLQTILG